MDGLNGKITPSDAVRRAEMLLRHAFLAIEKPSVMEYRCNKGLSSTLPYDSVPSAGVDIYRTLKSIIFWQETIEAELNRVHGADSGRMQKLACELREMDIA